ncbi:MAG: hypothetical protein H6Q28_1201 [Bacteroidetes bacterium]|nr:hypothetical protein [Bacteroidota bacterium]
MALLEQAARRGLALGLTGIGYDGEERDTVTLLPKPRIRVPAGALVTTSESCLQTTDAQWTGLRRTGFRTALGEVVVVRVTAPGLLVVAGPNKTHELEQVRRMLADKKLDLLMVDGSLNRIAPMAAVDRLVFSTGAARSTDLRAVVGEMAAIELLFAIPHMGEEDGGETAEEATVMTAGASTEEAARAAHGSTGVVRWKGLVALDLLSAMTPALGRRSATVLFDDPLKLVLAGDIRRVAEKVAYARSAGVRLICRRVPCLAAVTSNPFYPAYDGTVYSGSSVDAAVLQTALRAALTVPVVDVVRDGGEALFAAAWPA